MVLVDRVFATIPASDPDWEPRFTEAMAQAPFSSPRSKLQMWVGGAELVLQFLEAGAAVTAA